MRKMPRRFRVGSLARRSRFSNEFAFGHRYAVTYGNPEKNALKAIRHIVDSDEKILHYFSEKRLCALVRDIHKKEKKNAIILIPKNKGKRRIA